MKWYGTLVQWCRRNQDGEIFMCNRCGICLAIRATYDNHQYTGNDKPFRLIFWVGWLYFCQLLLSRQVCSQRIVQGYYQRSFTAWFRESVETINVRICLKLYTDIIQRGWVGLTSLITVTRSRTDLMISLLREQSVFLRTWQK